MGVGKTSVCKRLKNILPSAVMLDGDWCWDMSPFKVNQITKALVIDNITYLLNNFIKCTQFKNIVFCWVMHEQNIIDTLLSNLQLHDTKVYLFSLICRPEKLVKRLNNDIKAGVRNKDIIERSLARIKCYNEVNTIKIDVSDIDETVAADQIVAYVKRAGL